MGTTCKSLVARHFQQQNANITSFDHKHTAKTQTRLFVFPPEVQEPETQPLKRKQKDLIIKQSQHGTTLPKALPLAKCANGSKAVFRYVPSSLVKSVVQIIF